jgi:crooked neck
MMDHITSFISFVQLETGWEEYYDYIFPEDEASRPNLKLLAMAKMWKKTKTVAEPEESEKSSGEIDISNVDDREESPEPTDDADDPQDESGGEDEDEEEELEDGDEPGKKRLREESHDSS